MKLVIIEGPDRTGKNTLIKNICNNAENYVVRHWGTPVGNTDDEKLKYQSHSFDVEFRSASHRYEFYADDSDRYKNDVYVWNRSHIGEFVYGTMYRNTNPETWVFNLEKKYKFDIDNNIFLILLTASPEFLCQKDDGESFSADINNKIVELYKFDEAFEKSLIKNKLKLKIDFNNHYRQDVFQDVMRFIHM